MNFIVQAGREKNMIGGFGGCALDKIAHITGWPRQEETSYIKERFTVPGGMTLNALLAASRLGSPVSYRGALGLDEEGGFLLDCLNAEGVDTANTRRLNLPTPLSLILTDPEGKRTIFHQRGLRDRDYYPEMSPADRDRIESLTVLLLDGSWMRNAVEWAEEAKARKVPVVLDLSPNNSHPLRDKLLSLADYPILSGALAQRLTGSSNGLEQAERLQKTYGGVCVVTNGGKGLSYCDGERVRHLDAFPVQAVDTNGAGDTMHGAFAAALTRKDNLEESLKLAMAASALKCTGKGHEGLPDLMEAEAFMREHPNRQDWADTNINNQ